LRDRRAAPARYQPAPHAPPAARPVVRRVAPVTVSDDAIAEQRPARSWQKRAL
jgi:hypothetical protein